jgi:hypothetical protein
MHFATFIVLLNNSYRDSLSGEKNLSGAGLILKRPFEKFTGILFLLLLMCMSGLASVYLD